MTFSRRELLQRTAAGSALAILASNADGNPLKLPIGSQTWPTRSMLDDFPNYCRIMADMGVQRLELSSPLGYGREFKSLQNPREVKKTLSDHGLKSESSHFTMRELRTDQQKSLDWAKEIGIKQVIGATLSDSNGGSHPSMDQVKRAAEEYNKIAEISAKSGMQQGLHNEGFETSVVDGKRTYDMLFELLDPKLVKFQLQMSTVVDGFVAVDYFMKYPGRLFSMHLQDIDMRTPSPDGRRRQVAMGQGSIDWVATFKAAKVGGVKNYFVEQNMDLTQLSVAYLKTLRV